MITVIETAQFSKWLSTLRDTRGRALILVRVRRIGLIGHFGDHKSVGDGVNELRISFGPGYRVYYAMRGKTIVILLGGGDKGSQERDIAAAKVLAKEGLPDGIS